MKLSELKELGEKSTQGKWFIEADSYFHGPHSSQHFGRGPVSNTTPQADADAALIATMRNHWNALLKIADAVSRNPCRQAAYDARQALAELERVEKSGVDNLLR